MKTVKRISAIVLALLMAVSCFAGCSKSKASVKVIGIDLSDEVYALGVNKEETELLTQANDFIKKILSDGTFDGVGDTATTADSTWFIRNTKTCYRPINTYALCFDNMVTLDFEDELKSGYGGWAGYPFSFGNIGKKDAWRGYHQYMKLRIKNPTDNNMIAVQFNNGAAFATTQFMVMSIGAGKTEYQSYIYDLCYAATYPSGKGVILAGQQPGNNWTWKQGTPVTGLRFHLLGATCSYANAYLNNVFDEGETAADYDVYYEYFKRLDSRALIKKGNSVEIDYIVFGSDPMALAEYHSNMEDSASKS